MAVSHNQHVSHVHGFTKLCGIEQRHEVGMKWVREAKLHKQGGKRVRQTARR